VHGFYEPTVKIHGCCSGGVVYRKTTPEPHNLCALRFPYNFTSRVAFPVMVQKRAAFYYSSCLQSLLASEYGPPNRAIISSFSSSLSRHLRLESPFSNLRNGVFPSLLKDFLPPPSPPPNAMAYSSSLLSPSCLRAKLPPIISPPRYDLQKPPDATALPEVHSSPECPQATVQAKTSPNRSSTPPPLDVTAYPLDCPPSPHLHHAPSRILRRRDCARHASDAGLSVAVQPPSTVDVGIGAAIAICCCWLLSALINVDVSISAVAVVGHSPH
jgi:hypothetical protein